MIDQMESDNYTKSSILSQVILGGQDGLVNVLGVILGVATASGEMRIVLAAGLAATFAESISMAAVAYTSQMAQSDHYQAELEREKREIRETPEEEIEDIRNIYKAKGFSGKLLDDITKHITSDEKVWLSTMMAEEVKLLPLNKKDVINAGAIVGISAFIGSLIPLFPFFLFDIKTGVIISLFVSTVALFLVGAYKAKTTLGKPVKSGVEIAIIGIGAAMIGYVIGLLFRAY